MVSFRESTPGGLGLQKGLLEGLWLCSFIIVLLLTGNPLPHPSLSLWSRAGLFCHLKGRFETPSGVRVLGETRAGMPGAEQGAQAHSDICDGVVGALPFIKHSGSPTQCRRFPRS